MTGSCPPAPPYPASPCGIGGFPVRPFHSSGRVPFCPGVHRAAGPQRGGDQGQARGSAGALQHCGHAGRHAAAQARRHCLHCALPVPAPPKHKTGHIIKCLVITRLAEARWLTVSTCEPKEVLVSSPASKLLALIAL
eukprot:1195986-Prorocentrum_minimum.AAC.8